MKRLGVLGLVGVMGIGFCILSCGAGNQEKNGSETSAKEIEQKTEEKEPAKDNSCQSDADCIPSACCHPKSCVALKNSPEGCGDMVCTMDCVPGTMDCGAGKCACLEGVCDVNWAK